MGCFNSKGYDDDIPQHATARSDNKHLIGSHDTDAWGPPVPLRSASTHKSGQLLLQEQYKRSISTTTIANKVKKITTTTPASIQRSKSRSEVPAATNPKPRQAAPNAAIIDGEDQQEEAGNKPAVGFVPKVKTTHNRSSKSGILYQNTPYSKTHADGIPTLSELDLDVDDDALLLPIGSSPFDLQTNGSRQVRVLAGSFDLHYSVLTQRGYYPEALEKANQDSFCVRSEFGGDPSTHFFGVFDGHGEFGAHCSQFVKKHLCENLLKDPHYPNDVVQAYHSSFLATNAQLHRYNKVDDSMSGTTAITVLVRGRKIYVANVGDSRAVLAVRRGKKLIAKDISSDQTPYRADECARVKLSGARVMTLDQLEGLKDPNVQCWGGEGHDDGDPPRLWVANGMYPGTAFTRSIGDSVAEQIGVSAVPEVLVVELRRKHSFFVIASDGVFEFLSSQAVVDMVARYKNPKDACAAVVAEAYRLWLQYETRTDDITIIVVHIDGLKDIKAERMQSTDMDPQQCMQIVPYDTSPLVNGVELPKKQRPARMLSRARLRAIEASLDHDTPWVPSDPHAKTPGEEAHIERAMQGNFLFQSLTEDQRHTLCGCMKRMDVCAGDIIIKQVTC
jgi:serine/threonine protein phosphatase PrpC